MSKTKNLTAMTLAVALFGAATSCQKAENNNSTTNQNIAIAGQPVSSSTPAQTDTSTPGTPTETYKAAYAARKNKDVKALKKLMSKDILEFFTIIADGGEGKKQTLDELLTELCEEPQAASDETRNEKIDGNKATLEYLDDKGEWETMDFIIEDGAWKMTIEKPDKPTPEGKKTKK